LPVAVSISSNSDSLDCS